MTFISISELWNKWNIRSFVILSFLLQVFLVLFAPLRKKIVNGRIVFLLWLAYLMVDWVAAFGIGFISHNQGSLSTSAIEVDGALQAFWASFLLLHLSGPDTITAFSLEDSSLWRRHLLSFIFQVGATIYVYVHIFPSNHLLAIPTMLVFLAGITKNAERLRALNLSSFSRLRKSMLLSFQSKKIAFLTDESLHDDEGDQLIKELNVQRGARYSDEEVKLPESIVVKHAHYFFQIFRVFIGNRIFIYEDREMSRKYFRNVSAIDALRVISVELNFIYEVLYTKALAIYSLWGYIFRFITFTSIVLAFVVFNRLKKHGLSKLDVEITYSLLFGGIALEVIALFMLVFSDWTVVGIKRYNTGSSKLDSFLHKFVSAANDLRKPRFVMGGVERNINAAYMVLDTPFIFRRWSESISACNICSETLMESPRKMYKYHRCSSNFRICEKIISCLHQASKQIVGGYGLRKKLMITNTKYVSNNPFTKKLWIYIFKEVKRKSNNANNLREVRKIFEARGDLFLYSSPVGIECHHLLPYVAQANYDTSIIMWHLATESCTTKIP
ncbi:hypothetical protein ACJRO7_000274 [Eucalyptus globulus]|uniref:DUF4220 domain-containing protein n=1 Tax=Eucalyptus globulus TaxID=34317 RepID=A0ABD3LRA1_EUCGL